MIAEELKGNVINLEGHELDAVELGHTDTDYTTCLNVPSIGLVVAGDLPYNDVHLYLVESNAKSRREWISALDKIESLNPRAVIASHKRPGNDDNPTIIEQTRQYIREFDRLVETTTNAKELHHKMLDSIQIESIRGGHSGVGASSQTVIWELLMYDPLNLNR